jgi:hypothetical protein
VTIGINIVRSAESGTWECASFSGQFAGGRAVKWVWNPRHRDWSRSLAASAPCDVRSASDVLINNVLINNDRQIFSAHIPLAHSLSSRNSVSSRKSICVEPFLKAAKGP